MLCESQNPKLVIPCGGPFSVAWFDVEMRIRSDQISEISSSPRNMHIDTSAMFEANTLDNIVTNWWMSSNAPLCENF